MNIRTINKFRNFIVIGLWSARLALRARVINCVLKKLSWNCINYVCEILIRGLEMKDNQFKDQQHTGIFQ